jgi:hypothetical protein
MSLDCRRLHSRRERFPRRNPTRINYSDNSDTPRRRCRSPVFSKSQPATFMKFARANIHAAAIRFAIQKLFWGEQPSFMPVGVGGGLFFGCFSTRCRTPLPCHVSRGKLEAEMVAADRAKSFFDCPMTDHLATINKESTNENNTDVDRWVDARRLRINGKPCSQS